MIQIIPSIPTNDPGELRRLLAKAEGVVDRVSIDIVDGKFAANKTVLPDILEDVETTLLLDYQLMVVEPINWVEKCLRGQADRIIGHIERMESQDEFVGKLQEAGVGIGLALDLETPAARIDKHLLGDLDVVLLMSVKAGFGGQEFNKAVLEKIESLRSLREEDGASFKIHVDGGVNTGNIKDVVAFGADEVSIGKRIFEGDLSESIKSLMQQL